MAYVKTSSGKQIFSLFGVFFGDALKMDVTWGHLSWMTRSNSWNSICMCQLFGTLPISNGKTKKSVRRKSNHPTDDNNSNPLKVSMIYESGMNGQGQSRCNVRLWGKGTTTMSDVVSVCWHTTLCTFAGMNSRTKEKVCIVKSVWKTVALLFKIC